MPNVPTRHPPATAAAKPKLAARNSASDWVSFHSRESPKGAGPRLVVGFEDGTSKSFPATADALLIAYIPNGLFGRHPELSASLSDNNRLLVRFDLPVGKVRKAELLLTPVVRAPTEAPIPLPPEPFELAVHEVREEWNEGRVTWANQPAFKGKAGVTVPVDAKAMELRVDVTALIHGPGDKPAWHGWLLKVAYPLKRDDPAPGDGRGPESDLLALFPWEKSVGAAREAARAGDKLILASVRAHYDDGTNFSEQILLAAALADPDVRALVLARFVPVRVCYPAGLYAQVFAGNDVPFGPLGELGTALKDAKAPALVLATAGGKAVATLESIGTFDRDLFLRFLLEALAEASDGPGDEKDPWKLLARGELDAAGKMFVGMEDRERRYGLARVASLRGDHEAALGLCLWLARTDGPFRHESMVQAAHALVRLGRLADAEPLLREAAGSDGRRAAEAGYLLGCVLHRGGNPGKAAEVWGAVVTKHPRSPEAVRARARLTWPEAVAACESLTAAGVLPERSRTEIDRCGEEEQAVRRGAENLLAYQGSDGSWTAATQTETYRVAITALAARALHRWSAKLGGELGHRARAAAEKATRWLNSEIQRANPETCNSFGAAYLLDYFVDLEETKADVRGDTNGAVALLLGGQCPNGAWSYDLRFGKSWKGGFGGWPATDEGRTHSVNTGPALLALARARDAGFEVDPKSLEAGRAVLLKMRDGPGAYTYTYPVPESFKTADQSLGRGCVCEHALRRLDGASKEDLATTIFRFLENRRDLRMPVKLSAGWLPPRMVSSYFYFYAYDHAARAMVEHGERAAENLALLRDDILKVGEADGTWVDCETYGKPYGTAMALHILGLARDAREQTRAKP